MYKSAQVKSNTLYVHSQTLPRNNPFFYYTEKGMLIAFLKIEHFHTLFLPHICQSVYIFYNVLQSIVLGKG